MRRLSEIRHRNLATLLGYCQEDGLQMLVFEYLPNGTVNSHLYGKLLQRKSNHHCSWCENLIDLRLTDKGKESTTQLEFKQRLSIALGAAKGTTTL